MGITFMMLTLAVFYDIPQLNLGLLFTNTTSKNPDSEKVFLAAAGQGLHYGGLGPVIMPDEDVNTHRQVVRVRSRRDDSPSSPEEPTRRIP